ncbi:MAG: tetratricopeptide repeat protein, partial [Verrucomicrobiota bacterium]
MWVAPLLYVCIFLIIAGGAYYTVMQDRNAFRNPSPGRPSVPVGLSQGRASAANFAPINDVETGLFQKALQVGDVEAASLSLQKLRNKYRGHPAVHTAAGLLALAKRDFPLAREEAGEALRLVPDVPMARLILAHADRMELRFRDALPQYEWLVRRHPDSHEAWTGIGQCQAGMGNPREGLKSVRRALEVNPVHGDAVNTAISICLRLNDRKTAEAIFAKALKTAPREPQLLLFYADYCDQIEDFETSMTLVDRALEVMPGDPVCTVKKARALARIGNREEAVKTADAVLVVSSKHVQVNALAGLVYQLCGRYERAVE